jgi:hypothetical protein
MVIIGKTSSNADREKMADFDSIVIRALNPRGVFGLAEKVGDLRLSFFGYYYF